MSSTALTLNLPYREPFDPGVFDFLAVRAVPGIEEGSSASYARTLRLAHGDARFRVDYDAGAPGRPLVLTIGAVDLRDLPSLLSRVRRLLDLDADPGRHRRRAGVRSPAGRQRRRHARASGCRAPWTRRSCWSAR